LIAPVVELRGLCRRFGAVEAAKAVTLDLRPGEIHALIGPNGAGKSTLIGLTAGSLWPDAGTVHLGGEDVTRLDAVGRARRGLGRIFQVSSLAMEHSVLQNALLGAVGRSGRTMRFLRAAMGQADLAGRAMAALERVGLAEDAGRRVADLSHGQRRLLEVAVALTLEPKAFLMDEPMAGLGPRGRGDSPDFWTSSAPRRRSSSWSTTWTRSSPLPTGSASFATARSSPPARPRRSGATPGSAPPISGRGGMSLLVVEDIRAAYGPSQALFGVSLEVSSGEVLALMGRNGMGKTTTIRAICRLMSLSGGAIRLDGKDMADWPAYRAARAGIGLVPEGRRCFAPLTVEENLLAAARPGEWTLARATALFPRLGERLGQRAASLSGGEQQMLAIARALLTNPRLLVLDEATEGLAPVVRQEIWSALRRLKGETGMAILVVDKSLRELATVVDRAVMIERGATAWSGRFGELTREISERYLGV
jgi:branched-chain amino acid transport system ATP-binding protein